MESMTQVLLGAVIMGDMVAGLFFVRYWRITGDRFFLYFAASFFAVTVSRAMVDEHIPPFGLEPLGYLIRLLSYLFIIAGIVYKNRATTASRRLAPPRAAHLPQGRGA
jgi:hypothetical protein